MATEKKIFIVDDNEMLSMALEDHLTRRVDHEVSTFTTGEECMEQIGDMPDVVILDRNLDSEDKNAKNGVEILAAIKDYAPGIHVIMFSGEAGTGTADPLTSRADHHIYKSEDAFDQIAAIISQMS
ncbi:hypothetical protein GCM10023093_29510 [Nemorincola caseinilytica]|uniref:Response regulatory domain-containing protein n=1 Tax=Nemorincola caseinilytica TaxID=2054315 RepID=A0ABP8NQJ8_9BACT